MDRQRRMAQSRRTMLRLLTAAAGVGAAALLPACGAPADSGGAAPAEAPPGGVATAPTATPQPLESYGSASAAVKLRYWTILSSVDGIVMNGLVKRFTDEHPDIAVESLQGLTDFTQKLQAATISDTAPDVALIRHTYIGPFVTKNMLSPLSEGELAAAGIRGADYDPTVWEFTKYQGQQYAVPLDIHCHAMLYNKRLLAESGLAVPTTLEEWSAAVAAVTKGDTIGYNTFALGSGAQEYMAWFVFGLWRQFGVEMISADGKAAFNTPAGIEAVKWMHSIQQAGNPKSVATSDLQRTGQVASWVDGPWISTLFFDPAKSPAAPDLDVAPLPQRDPANKAVWGQSHQFALPRREGASPEQRAAALRFVLWMSEHSVDWAQAGQVPARNAAREEALTSSEPTLQKLRVWAEQLPHVAYMAPHPMLLEAMPRIAANVEGALLNQWSVEEALTRAEAEVNAILAEG